MLIGPVASHKVEDFEAASPNFLTHILHLWFYTPQLRVPFWPLIAQTKRDTPSRQQTGLPCLHTHGSVASRKVENSEAASPNSISDRLYYRHCLATGPSCEPPSVPLWLKAMAVHIVGPLQVYMLTGPVASHKVEDSEAASPTLPSTGYLFTIIGYRTQLWPPFCPLKPQSNENTPSRPHSDIPGLHANRARCIPQGRRFRGRIHKLSHPHTASLSLGTPTSSHILTLYNPKQPKPFRRPRPTAAALLLTTKLSHCATALLPTSQIVSLAVPCVVSSTNCTTLLRYCATVNFTNFLYCATANFTDIYSWSIQMCHTTLPWKVICQLRYCSSAHSDIGVCRCEYIL